MSVSVVIPVFNDTAALTELLQRLFQVSDGMGDPTELVLVDDGSTDETWESLKTLKALHPGRHILLLRLARNSGQHNATLCGLMHAHGDVMVTMDADLQNPPEAIPQLLASLRERHLDLVYGTALAGHGWARRFTSRLFKLLTHRLGSPRVDGSSFRALTASLARRLIANAQQPFTVIDSILQENADRIGSLAVGHHVRLYGKSGYTWRRLLLMALHVVAGAPEISRLLLILATFLAATGLGLLAFWAGTPRLPVIDALSGLSLLIGGLFLIYIRQRVDRWNNLSRLDPRFTLREKIE